MGLTVLPPDAVVEESRPDELFEAVAPPPLALEPSVAALRAVDAVLGNGVVGLEREVPAPPPVPEGLAVCEASADDVASLVT
jgi:hypothetical protein